MKIFMRFTASFCLMLVVVACQTPPKYADLESFTRAQNEVYFAEAYQAIDQLSGQGSAEKALADQLTKDLRAIDPNAPRLDEAGAVAALARARSILASGPQIDPSLAEAITSPLRDLAAEFERPVFDQSDLPCETPPLLMRKCPGEPLVVGAGAPGNGRFRTLAEALASAPAGASCKQRIIVESGWHDARGLRISRHVTLEGAEGARPVLLGGLEIAAPVSVTLKNLIVLGLDDPGVDAANRCASLALYDARVSGSADYGVRQRGGRLIASGLEIDHTSRRSGPESAGLYLENGVSALIVGARVHDNEGAGVLMEGADTQLWARDLSVVDTDVPAGWFDLCARSSVNLDGLGAVVARSGASADIHASLIGNDAAGLNAHSGGHIEFGRGEIRNTAELRDESCGRFASGHAGFGAIARGGGVRLTHFDIDNSGVCGVFIGEAGELDARHGVIRNSPIGACIQARGFEFRRISNDVAFIDNDRNVDATTLPLPDPGLPEF